MALVVGIKHLRDGIEPQAVLGSDMSIVGIVGTAPGADADVFPYNQTVEVRTNDNAKRTALGSSGTIVDALIGISSQLGGGVGAAKCVVVRVEEESDAFDTIANIIGSEAGSTGVWALLRAPEDLGLTPRLLIVPGYTSQSQNGVAAVEIQAGGTSYEVDDEISGTSGGGTGFSAKVGSVDEQTGAILTIKDIVPGSGYTSPPSLSVASGSGSGATLVATVEQLANPVCAIMPTICERLRGKFLPEGPTASRQAALDWMETLPRSMNIIHPLRQDAKVLDGDGSIVTKPLSPYVVGIYIRCDAERDGIPSRSAANQPAYGLVGVTPSIPLSIVDESSLGQTDLEQSFGIVVRGDVGADGALTDGGFTFWGTDTLSQESEWLFASVVRMRDYLELLQVKALRVYLGRYNITSQTVQAIVNTIDSQASRLTADGHLLDYRIEFDPDVNTPENLRLGHLDLTFKAEEPPVLRKITIRSRRHREALTNLVRNIAVQLGTQVAG